MGWVWSSEPSDWASQVAAICTAASALFTGAYVWLTYRLMKATVRVAEVAFLETRRDRIERLLPIKRTLDALRETLSEVSTASWTNSDSARVAAVLSRAQYDLDAHVDAALRITTELNEVLAKVHTQAKAALLIVSGTIEQAVTAQSQLAIAHAARETVSAVDIARECISRELEHAGHGLLRVPRS